MGPTRQQTQRKPAMVIVTSMVRVAVPARLPEADEESLPFPSPLDPNATPGRVRYVDCSTRSL
jgi:hypothetical protein